MYSNECVFVLKPEKIISKYMGDYEYTDFTNNETRYSKQEKEDSLYHARKLVDILTQ